MTTERRRSPRIEILGRLHGHSVSLELPVKVLEISLGGMAIETSRAFPVGAVQAFRLTLGDDSTVELNGRIMHCRNTAPEGDPPVHVMGVQFVEDDVTDTSASVGDLINRVK